MVMDKFAKGGIFQGKHEMQLDPGETIVPHKQAIRIFGLENFKEVVRCKDCDNTCPGSNGLVCTAWGARTDPYGWCYKAERRTDGKSL